MNELMLKDNGTILSTELTEVINEFRKQEGNNKELLHKNLLAKIKKRTWSAGVTRVRQRAKYFAGWIWRCKRRKTPLLD